MARTLGSVDPAPPTARLSCSHDPPDGRPCIDVNDGARSVHRRTRDSRSSSPSCEKGLSPLGMRRQGELRAVQGTGSLGWRRSRSRGDRPDSGGERPAGCT